MTSSRAVQLALAAVAVAFVTATAPSSAASQAEPASSVDQRPQFVRALLGVELVTRHLDVRGPTDVAFDAPYYAGLLLRVEAYPVAWFAPESRAAGLSLWAETSKHATTTAVGVRVDDDVYDLSVPTRHDMSYFALAYAWTGSKRLQITPALGWRTTEFSLGYNAFYGSSFYRGLELSLRTSLLPARLPVRLDAMILGRPALSLGSTATAFGDRATARGVGANVGATVHTRVGVTFGAEIRAEWVHTRYTAPREDSTSDDFFQSFVISVGYAL